MSTLANVTVSVATAMAFPASGNASNVSVDVLDIPDTTMITIIMTVLYVIIFLLGVIGNALVIFVIYRNPDMSTATNIFLVNLSIADLLVLLVCMPIGLIDLYAKDVWLLGSFMCKFASFLEICVTNGSVMTMLAISFERYYAICRPLEVLYTCTKSRAIKIIMAVWVFSVVSASPFFIISYTELSMFHDQTMKKVCRSAIDTTWKHAYNLAIFAIFFLLPCIILTMMYMYICRELHRSQRGMAQLESIAFTSTKPNSSNDCKEESLSKANPTLFADKIRPHHSVKNARTMTSRRQVIYMLITIIVFSFSCLLPFRIFTLWIVYSPMSSKKHLGIKAIIIIVNISRLLYYMNSAGNPVLYNMMSTKFREACKRSMYVMCKNNKSSRSPIQMSRQGPQSRYTKCWRYDSSTKGDVLELDSIPRYNAVIMS